MRRDVDLVIHGMLGGLCQPCRPARIKWFHKVGVDHRGRFYHRDRIPRGTQDDVDVEAFSLGASLPGLNYLGSSLKTNRVSLAPTVASRVFQIVRS